MPRSQTGAWSGIPIVYDPDLIDRSAPSFIGRESEIKKLESLLQQAIEGTGRIVFITGEPGIGKTSLSDEFLRSARKHPLGLLISRGRCVEQYGTGEAYLPFLDAMGELLQAPGRERIAAVMRTFAPTWCMELPTAFVSSGSLEKLQQETIGATKERMMREMGDALGMLASASPVVLLLEDLHWADPSSVDLLRHYKAEMQAHNLCDELALDSWTREHIAEYLDATFSPNDFPGELAALIHEKTEGHPLFAANLLQYLGEQGDLSKTNGRWSLVRPLSEMDLVAPESVRAMISKKIDALDPEERRALQYASIEGTEFLSSVVAKLLGIDEIDLEESLARIARSHRLIDIQGEEELPDGTLATRYRFAHALYQNFLYSDLVNKRRVMLHQQAGEQLLTHYGKRAPQIATQLAMHFEQGRGFLLLTCYFFRGLSQGNQGRMSASLATLSEALDKARRNGDLFWHPRFPNCIGWIYRELYDFESAHKYNEDGIEVSRRTRVLEAEANSLINRGIDCTRAGEHQQTVAAFHEVRDIFERDAWFRWRYNIRFEAAMAEHWLSQGDLTRARQFVDRLHGSATEHEVHKYIAVAHQLMAKLALANGDTGEAEKQFDAALVELENYPAPLVTWKVHAGRAKLKLQLGDTAGAQESSARATEIVNFIAANVNDENLRTKFLTATKSLLDEVSTTSR